MKNKLMLVASLALLLGACSIKNNPSASSSSSEIIIPVDSSSSSEGDKYNLAELQRRYGNFSYDDTSATYDQTNKTLTIDVAAVKKEVTVSGYFDGSIVIANRNNLSTYKKVEIKLNGACIVSQTMEPAIKYTLDLKNVSIVSKGDTTNYLINTETGSNGSEYAYCAAYSEHNLKIDLRKGSTLNILTEYGHCAKAKENMNLFGKGTLYLNAGHDGLHGKNFITNNEEIDEKFDEFTGTLNCDYAFSQVMDFSSSGAKGDIEITTGTYVVSNVESVFKTDSTLKISNGVSITATNVLLEAVVLGDNATELHITNNGTFTVNGAAYTKTVITR